MGMKRGECLIGKNFNSWEKAQDAARIYFPGLKCYIECQGERGYVITAFGKSGNTKWTPFIGCGELFGDVKI